MRETSFEAIAGGTGLREAIGKADVLIEALPYIQRFRNRAVVVKFGGSAMEDAANMRSVLQDVAFMRCVGLAPVVLHGGGRAISRRLQAAGIETKFVQGLRNTCERTIQIVRDVLTIEINSGITRLLTEIGAFARGLRGENVFVARKRFGKDEATGKRIDLGYVGEPVRVRTRTVLRLLRLEAIPVLTPLGRGPDGKVYNLNADVAASALARALRAWKLVFLTDVPGIMRNPADPRTLISTVTAAELRKLACKGVISGGMLPKMESCIEALEHGVGKIHIIDGRLPHSLLLEIFTDSGIGTEIVGA